MLGEIAKTENDSVPNMVFARETTQGLTFFPHNLVYKLPCYKIVSSILLLEEKSNGGNQIFDVKRF